MEASDLNNAKPDNKGRRQSTIGKTLKDGFSLASIMKVPKPTKIGRGSSYGDSAYSSEESVPFVSCLKGSQSQSAKQKKQKVRFPSSRTPHSIRKIDPLFSYSADLWWTKSDLELLKADQSDFSDASAELKTSAMSYLLAYKKARQQVFPSTKNQVSKPMMTSDVYNSIVAGRNLGFAGLELYSDESQGRRAGVKEVILLTLAAYYDFLSLKGADNASKMLRSYSRTLTAADRYWAVAMGNADSTAATGTDSSAVKKV